MKPIERTIQQIADVLGDSGHFSESDWIEFLSDEFSDGAVVKVFAVAYGARTSTMASINRAAKQITGIIPLRLVNAALKKAKRGLLVPSQKDIPAAPIPKITKSSGGMVFEIQSPEGSAMLWGKTYGDNVPLMQISFDKSDIREVGKFLRSLGFNVADER
jgi:hypothetical protein